MQKIYRFHAKQGQESKMPKMEHGILAPMKAKKDLISWFGTVNQ